MFQTTYAAIITNIQKSLGKDSGWIIDSFIDHTISILKYNLWPEAVILNYLRKELIKIQNTEDNECFKWCLGRYLNPVDHNPRRITKADRDFAMILDFKDIKLPVKIKDIQKSKKRITLELVFLAVKLKESIQSMYQKNVATKSMQH